MTSATCAPSGCSNVEYVFGSFLCDGEKKELHCLYLKMCFFEAENDFFHLFLRIPRGIVTRFVDVLENIVLENIVLENIVLENILYYSEP